MKTRITKRVRPVNIFSRPQRLYYLHIHDFFLSLPPPDISNSRVDFSGDDSSRTRRVVTTRQHFQPSSAPPLSSHTRFFLSLPPPDISNSRVDFSGDDSSRTRRVVTTRQHFQPASAPLLSSHTRFFLSLPPPDISNSRVDFSSDDSSLTRRVVTTRQHFQPASAPLLSSHTRFFVSLPPPDISKSLVDFSSDDSSRTRHFQKVPQAFFQIAISCYFTSAHTTTRLPLYGSSTPKSRPDSIRVYWTALNIRSSVFNIYIYIPNFFFCRIDLSIKSNFITLQ